MCTNCRMQIFRFLDTNIGGNNQQFYRLKYDSEKTLLKLDRIKPKKTIFIEMKKII